MKNINEKINELSEEQRHKFDKTIIEVCYSRSWCSNHNIDYVDPDITQVKNILYKEMIEGDKSYYNS